MIKFPYSRPEILNSDKEAVLEVLNKGYLTQGEKLLQFEDKLQNTFKCKNVIACNSGTAALHLLYLALGLGPNNALLTSSITFLATASAAKMCDAPVVFADVDPISGLLTPENIEKAIIKSESKIKVISVVHLAGKICDMEGIAEVAKKYDCMIVEDACHAPGGEYVNSKNKHYIVGSCKYSVASTFSFHAIKHISMGEGGCVATNDKILANKIRIRRNHSIIKDQNKFSIRFEDQRPWYYEMQELGWNYRLDEISCALGISQLKRLYSGIEKRKKLAARYYNELKCLEELILPADPSTIDNSVWHLYSLLVDFNKIGMTRGDLMNKLSDFGIGTQVHYIPLFYQPYFKEDPKNYPGAVSYYNSTLSLPMYVSLNNKDITFISNCIKNIIYE